MLENPAPPPRTSPGMLTPSAADTSAHCWAHAERSRIGNRGFRGRRVRTGVPTGSPELDWLRQSLRACDLLTSVHSISPTDRALVAFAIDWALYGGADADCSSNSAYNGTGSSIYSRPR
jgi:hypothetical protein